MEYVWERQEGDNRMVLAKDSVYQKILKESFMKAVAEKWNAGVPPFDVKVNKRPMLFLRNQPKFITSMSNSDTSKHYVFLQLFDQSIPIDPNRSMYSAIIDVRYRLVKAGTTLEDKTVSFKILKRNPVPGQIAIKRYPFHPSQFKFLCDTIASTILKDEVRYESEMWLQPACGYAEQPVTDHITTHKFQFAAGRQSIKVSGENGFTIMQDSVNDVQTGKKRHGGGNTAGSLLTFFSNIDTEKKRSTLHTADHSFSEGSTTYHAYVSYVDTRVADRRRVKDEDGSKSVEVSEYHPGWKEINPYAKHQITMNGDTVSSFNIEFRLREDHFDKMWDGQDPATIESMPPAFNNFARFEMEMKGTIDESRFVLKTSGEGQIKRITLNDDEVYYFNCNTGSDGLLTYRNLSERQLKIITLLCLLSDKYYQYN
jgi:hypothetical protein